MNFDFEYHEGDNGWQPVGSGEGSGDNAVIDAFNRLKAEGGPVDQAGTYRYAYPGEDQPRFFDLDGGGNIRFVDHPDLS